MKNTAQTPSTQAEAAAERFALRVTARLSSGTEALPYDISERLRASRMQALAKRTGRRPCSLSPAATRLLMAYDWPGNVRELENMLEQCATLSRHGAITPADLPERMRVFNVSGASGRPSSISHSAAAQTLEDKEATAIREALAVSTPDIGFYGEESGGETLCHPGDHPRRNARTFASGISQARRQSAS